MQTGNGPVRGIRIGHCIHGLDLGGAQKVIASILRGLGDDYDPFVYSVEDGVLRAEVEATGAKVRIVPRRLKKIDPLCALELAARFREDGLDLVHGHLFGDSIHGYAAARLAGSPPVIITVHNHWPAFTRLQQFGYRRLFSRCAATVACSQVVHRSLQESRARFRALLSIPNGIEDLPETDGAGVREELGDFLTDDGLVFVCVGRVDEQKGQKILVEAFSRVVEEAPGSRLLIVGDGPQYAERVRQVEQLGLTGSVRFLGARTDIPDVLAVSDVVVMPSLWEGLPIALLEALASARCLVCSGTGGIEEAVRHEVEALLVEPGSVDDLVEALLKVSGDEALRKRLQDAARDRYRSCYSSDVMVSAYRDLYERVLSNRG